MNTDELRDRLRRAEQYKPMLDRAQHLALDLSKLLDKRDEEIARLRRSQNIVHLTPMILEKERQSIRIEIFQKVFKLVRMWKDNHAKLEQLLKEMIAYEKNHDGST